MAALVVQEKAGATRVNGAAAEVILDAAPSVGNMLVGWFHSPSSGAVPVVPTGWTVDVQGDDAGRPSLFMHKAVASGDGTTYSMSGEYADGALESETSELHIWEVSGLDTAGLVHDTSVGVAAETNTTSAGAMDCTSADGGIAFVGAGLGATSGGSPAFAGTGASGGFSDPAAGHLLHTRSIVGSKVIAATASGINPTISWTTIRRNVAVGVLYKAAPAGSSGYLAQVYTGSTWKNHEMHVIT